MQRKNRIIEQRKLVSDGLSYSDEEMDSVKEMRFMDKALITQENPIQAGLSL